MSETPILHTDRLTLRPHTMADFAPYAAALATDRSRHMGGPMSEKQSWAMFCKDVARARDWAFETLALDTLVSYVHRDNARSIALAERLGAAPDAGAPPCPYRDHLVYRHPAPEVLQ